MSTIRETGDALYTVIDRVENLRLHRYPPDQSAEFPCAFLYPRSGKLEQQNVGGARNFHNWVVDILESRQDIAQSAERIEPYIDLIQSELWKDLADPNTSIIFAAMDHIGTDVDLSYEILAYELAGKPVFGYRLTIPVKTHRIIT